MTKIPWEAAPQWLREDRTVELLRTARPRPHAEKNWRDRMAALRAAERGLDVGEVRERVTEEIKAMLDDRSRESLRTDMAARVYRTADEEMMLTCLMRAEQVRGMTKTETSRARLCYVDGMTLPKARVYWCSDECVERWTSNHEWSAASTAALNRDGATCQRCGYQPTLMCNGRHVGARTRPPWPCATHRHPAYRTAVPSEAEPGICGRCRTAWPCEVAAEHPGITGHWQLAQPRLMEVNHKIPRNGAGYGQGCHHHLDLLETLCHPCHVIETTRQGRERRGLT